MEGERLEKYHFEFCLTRGRRNTQLFEYGRKRTNAWEYPYPPNSRDSSRCCVYLISSDQDKPHSLWDQIQNLKRRAWGFPGVVKTLRFHCKEHRLDPWSGILDPTCCAPEPKTKPKKKLIKYKSYYSKVLKDVKMVTAKRKTKHGPF